MDKRFDGFTLAESDNSTPMGSVSEGRKRIKAFTLAEVLITLGVIGVVAAMTMPVLIQNHKKQVTVTKLKKAYSEISQAIKLSEVHNGEMENWDFSNFTPEEKNKYFGENYILPYLKTVKICESNSTECINATHSGSKSAITTSGYSIITWADSIGGWVYVDIDGPSKGNNEFNKDIYQIKLVKKQNSIDTYDHNAKNKKGIHLNGLQYITPKTRDELKESKEYCGALIMYDGWKILDDNPCFSK